MALKALADGRLFGSVFGGESPSVLALHGWGRSSRDFAGVLDGLDAISLDLPGFGATPAPEAAVGAHGYAEIVAPVLAHFERPPIALAHSFGGRVAVAMEADAPGTFSGMLLTGVPLLRRGGSQTRPPIAYRMVRLANRIGLLSDERLEREKRSRGSADYRTASGVMRDVLVTVVNESYERELEHLALPVHLLWGVEDGEVPVEIAERAVEIIGDQARLETVQGGGHLLPVSHADRVRSALEALL